MSFRAAATAAASRGQLIALNASALAALSGMRAMSLRGSRKGHSSRSRPAASKQLSMRPTLQFETVVPCPEPSLLAPSTATRQQLRQYKRLWTIVG
jgi:hypothetical protein